MCGIGGVCFSLEENFQYNTETVVKTLLGELEMRGRDAAGIAWYKPDSNWECWYHRAPTKASLFVPYVQMSGFTPTAIVHTRAYTKGHPSNEKNNHPIWRPGVLGVHNGMIVNDDEIFRALDVQREGEVDSEAAFALIAHGLEKTDKGIERVPSAQGIGDCLAQLQGSAALAWLDFRNQGEGIFEPNVLHLARVYSSPLVIAQSEGGSLVFASTESAIRSAFSRAGMKIKHSTVRNVSEGTYLKVRQGEIVEEIEFESISMANHKSTGSYSKTGYKNNVAYTSSGRSWSSDTPALPRHSSATTHHSHRSSGDMMAQGHVPANQDPWDEDDEYSWALGITSPTRNVKPDASSDFSSSSFYVSHNMMADNLLDVFGHADLPLMESAPYFTEYADREKNIEQFSKSLPGEDEDKLDLILPMKAEARPGDWVYTDLGHMSQLIAQIVYMPQDFPYGEYVLRVMIPNSRYVRGTGRPGVEPVLVSRFQDEFTVITNAGVTKSLPTVTQPTTDTAEEEVAPVDAQT